MQVLNADSSKPSRAGKHLEAPGLLLTETFILLGGCLLAFGAGFADAYLFLSTGASVSHLTGDMMRLSTNLPMLSPAMSEGLRLVGSTAIGFLLGAMLAGFWMNSLQLDLSRPYGRAMMGIGTLFLLAFWLQQDWPVTAIGLAALGCGLQNGLATRYRGVALRTTHLTGLITDFGLTLGMRMRGVKIPPWKIVVPLVVVIAFFLGGMSSSLVFFRTDWPPLLLVGVGYIVFGGLWSLLKRWPTQEHLDSES